MSTVRKTIAALVVCVLLEGCCSVVGTLTKPAPYVGVQLAASGVVNTNNVPTEILCALDLPGSAVLDTVLLPLTVLVWASEKEQGAK